MKTPKTILLLLIIISLGSYGLIADCAKKHEVQSEKMHKGKHQKITTPYLFCPSTHAIQFKVTDFLKFSSFSEGMFGYKHRINKKHSWRIGIDIDCNYNEEDRNQNERINLPDTTMVSDFEIDYKYQQYALALSVDYMTYGIQRGRINHFFAIGPFVRYSTMKEDPEKINYSNIVRLTYTEETMNTWQVGAQLSYGVEWMIRPQMSLSLEYLTKIYYMILDNDQTLYRIEKYTDKPLKKTTIDSELKREGIECDAKGIRLGLTVYF